jgi:acyl-CoA thioesterase
VSERVTPADFGTDTAVEPLGDGRYMGQSPGAWFGPIAPNGGFIAALVVRAMTLELGVDDREPRSLTVHFLRPPAEGQLELHVVTERVGRTASTVTTRILQDGRLMALALCTWTQRYQGAEGWELPAPDVPRPEQVDALGPEWSSAPRMFSQLDVRPVFGAPPFSGGDEAIVGGWLRPLVPHSVDHALLALLCDAWWPSAFTRLWAPSPAPTLDLTIHFRGAPPVGDHAFVLGRFRSRAAVDGLFEEDGELWSEDGRLLAQSRQLALLPKLG